MTFLHFYVPSLTPRSNSVLVTDGASNADVEEVESNIGIKRAEQLMSSNLSGSQLDLFIHGEGDPFAPGHVKPKQENQPHQNDNELNKTFLESEKKRISQQPNSNASSDGKEHNESIIETSTL